VRLLAVAQRWLMAPSGDVQDAAGSRTARAGVKSERGGITFLTAAYVVSSPSCKQTSASPFQQPPHSAWQPSALAVLEHFTKLTEDDMVAR
jgi:hypothetical protein